MADNKNKPAPKPPSPPPNKENTAGGEPLDIKVTGNAGSEGKQNG